MSQPVRRERSQSQYSREGRVALRPLLPLPPPSSSSSSSSQLKSSRPDGHRAYPRAPRTEPPLRSDPHRPSGFAFRDDGFRRPRECWDGGFPGAGAGAAAGWDGARTVARRPEREQSRPRDLVVRRAASTSRETRLVERPSQPRREGTWPVSSPTPSQVHLQQAEERLGRHERDGRVDRWPDDRIQRRLQPPPPPPPTTVSRRSRPAAPLRVPVVATDQHQKAYTNSYPYEEVHVMMVSFQHDDMNVREELLDATELFQNDFGFVVDEPCIIPSHEPARRLKKRLKDFTREFGSSQDTLLILVIACHGILRNQELILGSTAENGAEVEWKLIRDIIMATEAPVLVVLDCCAAAGAGVDPANWATLPADQRRARTNKELIAASGFHEQAPEPGEFSLTNSLLDALHEAAARTAKAGELTTASDVYGRTKARMLTLYVPGADTVRTPVYEILSNGGQSIVLAPTPQKRQAMLATRPAFRSAYRDIERRRRQRCDDKRRQWIKHLAQLHQQQQQQQHHHHHHHLHSPQKMAEMTAAKAVPKMAKPVAASSAYSGYSDRTYSDCEDDEDDDDEGYDSGYSSRGWSDSHRDYQYSPPRQHYRSKVGVIYRDGGVGAAGRMVSLARRGPLVTSATSRTIDALTLPPLRFAAVQRTCSSVPYIDPVEQLWMQGYPGARTRGSNLVMYADLTDMVRMR